MRIFEQKVAHTITAHHLLPTNGLVLVGLSGGADSVALLRVLLYLGYRVVAAHCNFRLRPEECMRDEHFVEMLCQQLDVRLCKADFNTAAVAHERKISIEMAARDLRYAFFNQWLAAQQEEACVAVAHHRGDQAETVLLHLMRGTGLRGLAGMRWRNGQVIRPLLDVSRQEILEYLAALGQDYVEDSSNQVADVQRNHVRLKVIPRLHDINPSVEATLARSAAHLAEASDYTNYHLDKDAQRMISRSHAYILKINISALMCHSYPHLILFHLLHPHGFNGTQVDNVLQAVHRVGARFETAEHLLTIDREWLLLEKKQVPIALQSLWLYPPCQIETDGHRLKGILCPPEQITSLRQPPQIALLDVDKLQFPLEMRLIKAGDRFQPFGMKGQKLVSDFLTDRKVALGEKQRQWVITSAGQIVWLVGHRIDHQFALTASTHQVLQLKWE